MTIRAVGFDLFGTLAEARADWRECVEFMCSQLRASGYDFTDTTFVTNYQAIATKYRKTRETDLREVNNGVWVADTLKRMDYDVDPSDPSICSAVDCYFSKWEVVLVPDAVELLEATKKKYTVSLVSNFTDRAFLGRTLERLDIAKFFDHVIDSDTFGWRKPHPGIFKRFLDLSAVEAEEAVFVGDDLEADVKGAKEIGIRAVYISRSDKESRAQYATEPDWIVGSLNELAELLRSM